MPATHYACRRGARLGMRDRSGDPLVRICREVVLIGTVAGGTGVFQSRLMGPHHLITGMLDDLYCVMSYSRWKGERFWALFRDYATAGQGVSAASLRLANVGEQVVLKPPVFHRELSCPKFANCRRSRHLRGFECSEP
jgi:hypothetical protein